MDYTLHSEPQGSQEWLAGRNTRLNASELVLASGDGMNGMTRSDLIRKIATGIEPEVTSFQQKLFADGHRFEALACPIAEQIMDRSLYPITVSIEVPGLRRRIGASLDGATDDDSHNFEHKSMNKELRATLAQGVIPVEYHWQMEQGQMINGATRTLFMASKWDKALGDIEEPGRIYGLDVDEGGEFCRYVLVEEMHVWYETNPELRAKIIPIWKQVEADADNYQHVEVIPAAVAAPQMALPAVIIKVEGVIALRDNLPAFGIALKNYIADLNRKPETDQDFADLDTSAKLLRDVQTMVAAARDGALGQIESVDAMKRAADVLEELARVTAIEIENLVKAEKANRRAEIIQYGKDRFSAHVATLNSKIGRPYMPQIVADFAVAIKGKSKLDNIRDAVETMLANKKIEADGIAERIETNLGFLRENAADYNFLFADCAQIVLKANDDFAALVKLRITEHKQAEESRIAAERVKLEAGVRAKVEAEARARIQPGRYYGDALDNAAKNVAELVPGVDFFADVVPNSSFGVTAAAQPAPPTDTGARIKLGEICERLAIAGKPLILSADQLAALGFDPAETIKAAKLYPEHEFRAICSALARHIQNVAMRPADI